MAQELSPDQKGQASLTLGDVIVQTRTNFPDPMFHPEIFSESRQYHRYGIDTHGFHVWPNADGIGTKPEFAERLYTNDDDPIHFETLAFDTFAMIESDVARTGQVLLGIAHVIDINEAQDSTVISALTRGTKRVCDEGRFALLNGETAELGYRSSGYGNTRINWNAVGFSIIVPNKFISGDKLKPNQPVVALRETSIRSNGLTKARQILEAAYLNKNGHLTKEGWLVDELINMYEDDGAPHSVRNYLADLPNYLNYVFGHDYLEQVLVPWHEEFPDATREILSPSTLYSKLIYGAQGGVYGDKLVDITGAAHISGGGVPEKGKRMVEDLNLGLHIEPQFPDPEAVTMLMDIARGLPNEGINYIDDRTACQQWNRGIGFMVATATRDDADRFVQLAESLNYEAAIAGEVIDKKEIEFRGHTWTY